MKELVEKCLKEMCVPCNDDGIRFLNIERIENIKKLLKETRYKLLYEDCLFLVYGKNQIDISKKYMLVSSHVDCLQSVSLFYDKNEYQYHGIFDNAATNAAILSLMSENRLPDNTLVVFTGDEEKNGNGAKRVADWLSKINVKYTAIALDVTSEGWKEGYDYTIENYYVLSNESVLKTTIKYLCREYENCIFIPAENGIIPHDIGVNISENSAGWDEACDYANMGGETFSLCLPCSAQSDVHMHSNSGFDIRKSSLYTYILVLERILSLAYEISIEKNKE